MLSHPAISGGTLITPPEGDAPYIQFLQSRQTPKPLQVVPVGGATRQQSVWNGLQTLPDGVEWIAVHDSARPLVSHALIDRLFACVQQHGCAVPALHIPDALKRVDSEGRIHETFSRQNLYRVQTPQLFRRDWLLQAHQRAQEQGITDADDDSTLLTMQGYSVPIVPGDPMNLKLTTPEDLQLLKYYAGELGDTRTGIGYDIHRLVEGRALMLGGVPIPFNKGLEGHSDADVLLHALCDALLGAAGLGDIGHHFPNTDARWKDCASLHLLREVHRMLTAHGWQVVHTDATLIAEAPKIAPYIPAMRTQIAQVLNILPEQVSIKATTNERMDAVGEGQAIACFAIATVQRHPSIPSLNPDHSTGVSPVLQQTTP